jgi:hypothetical protein
LLYFAQYGELNDVYNPVTSKAPLPTDKDHVETGNESAWKIRAGAAIALIDVYQQFHGTPHGLLAREMLSNRKQKFHASMILNRSPITA